MVEMLAWIAMILGVFFVFQRVRELGFLDGFRPVWLIALLVVPCWFYVPMRTLHLDARSATAAAILMALLMQPFSARSKPVIFLTDYFLLVLIATICASNIANGNLAPLMPIEVIRDWLLPYLVGRLFLQSSADVDRVLPTFCWIFVFLSLYSVFEGVSKVNVIDRVMGKDWTQWGMDPLGERWGMKRANVNQSHPIYFGISLAMLLPWALRASRLAAWKQGPNWWRFTPWLLAAGMVCTGSRSAQIVAFFVVAADVFYRHPKYRAPLLIMGLLGCVIFFTYRDDVVALLSKIGQEKEEVQKVKINGLWRDYNGTLHRDLLLDVYRDAVDDNQPLGYGTGLETMKKHLDPHMDARFKSIDNHYLRFYLQYGIVGSVVFGLLGLAGLWNFLPTIFRDARLAVLSAGLFGGLAGTFLVLRGVYLSMDFGWVLLFTIGLGAGIERVRRSEEMPPNVPAEHPV